ncbi:MAG: ribonuclease HI family protein [Gemmatimonadota bacterium]|nr:ribonuclease HI family protein [Gemmatimonadota bacterium]
MRRLVIRTDGAARGNPGPAGAGWVIEDPDGTVVSDGCAYLGEATNNQAEYQALLRALEAVDPDADTEIEVFSDSELMVKQLNGEYRVKNEGLKPLYVRAVRYLLRAGRSEVRHVRRGENEDADALANQAIDAYSEV